MTYSNALRPSWTPLTTILMLIGFWVVNTFGRGGSSNPYLGILFDVFLPGLFVLGLILIPIGIWLRHNRLKALGELPSIYPRIGLRDPVFRRGIEIVVTATFINFITRLMAES